MENGVSGQAMSPEELEHIGTVLFGEWGWPVKLGKLIGKDASTLRRWRLGTSNINPKYAEKIRNYYQNNQHRITSDDTNIKKNDTYLRRILEIVVAVERNPLLAIRVNKQDNLYQINLLCSDGTTISAKETVSGSFDGLDNIESFLNIY